MKEVYDWVPWFRELGKKIDEGGEQFLIDKAKSVAWKADNSDPPLLKYGDDNIDPFSFIYTLANLNDNKNWNRIYPAIQDAFGLTTVLPVDLDDALFFPTPSSRNLLFHGGQGRSDPALLWRLFRDAVAGFETIKPDDFQQALNLRNVAITKLSQALFLVNPSEFLPFNNQTNSLGFFDTKSRGITLEKYASCIDKVRKGFPGCELYEVNLFAYLLHSKSSILNVDADKFFQASTDVNDDGIDRWKEFEANNHVYTGGLDNRIKYPLQEPKRGDVILVGFGGSEGRGVGVVYRNDYQGEFDEAHRLHVLWLNKESAAFEGMTGMDGFSPAGNETLQLFRQAKEYVPTFEMLHRLSTTTSTKSENTGAKPEEDTEKEINHGEFPLNQILYGPPGTGKTWSTTNLSLKIIGKISNDRETNQKRFADLRFNRKTGTGQIEMITFHQNFAYEDFIEGIRPKVGEKGSLSYEMHTGIFKHIVEVAKARRNERFVVIIDEINRGNIAKIFGELITLIEDSRRLGQKDETCVTLPYSGENFGIPDNLYLIGTMNTADRSIQLLDTALRRRFIFRERMPEPEHEYICRDINGIDCSKLLKAMNRRIATLLDREHQIGHTYLLNVDSMEKLSDAMRDRIFPLLQEYFFDDWAKIRAVLGQNGFVMEKRVENLMVDPDMPEEERVVHERLPEKDPAWDDPGEYRKIYEGDRPGNPEEP